MLRDKIKNRMDTIQNWMESNYHLEHPEEVIDMIYSVTKFWSILSDEDKDYIECAKYAAIENKRWDL